MNQLKQEEHNDMYRAAYWTLGVIYGQSVLWDLVKEFRDANKL